MTRGPYTYTLSHGPDTVVRLLLNDIPFYRVPHQRDRGITETCPVDHWLVPGLNTFDIELAFAEERYFITFSIEESYDREHPIFRYEWPRVYRTLPIVRQFPFVHGSSFTVPDLTFRSVHLDAPCSAFPLSGNEAQQRAVMRLYDTLLRADADAFMDAMALKTAELNRAYDGHPLVNPDKVRGQFRERFSRGLTVKPVSVDELVFESRADGRVAYVTRKDGGQPIDVETPTGEWMAHDLWLTFHNGDWRVFR